MDDVIIESIRAVVLAGLFLFLWRVGRNRFEHTRQGWGLVLAGFGFLLFGSAIDVTDNFESLNHFVVIGDTETQAILEKVVGFLGGFSLLAVGLFRWIPTVQRLTDEINERKRVEEELIQARDKASSYAEDLFQALQKEKELSGLQRQFVSMVSHEFRTPLAIIDGSAQRLQRRKDQVGDEKLGSAPAKIRNAVRRLTDLMESVLSVARLEDGRIKFEPADCDIVALLKEICASYRELGTGHRIIEDVDRLGYEISGDEKLLRQAFSNLLSNAIKYAPDGTTVWVEAHSHESDHVVVSIRDEGIGIPEAELDKLFTRFFRASTAAGIAGSGIGLHLVKHLVDMHGGTVDVTSEVDQGSTFTVRLPRCCSRAKEKGHDSSTTKDGYEAATVEATRAA